jgi:hypothetical protein
MKHDAGLDVSVKEDQPDLTKTQAKHVIEPDRVAG